MDQVDKIANSEWNLSKPVCYISSNECWFRQKSTVCVCVCVCVCVRVHACICVCVF